MKLLIAVFQVTISLGLSALVALDLAQVYVVVALLVAASSGVLLIDATKAREPVDVRGMVTIGMMATAFGLIWPALPLIIAWSTLSRTTESHRE